MPQDLFELTGSVALVTGGSRGLGREMVLAFAQHGADVVIASRKLENCNAVAAEVRALGRRALPVAYHAGSWADADALADAAYAEFGKIDILVNNAGMSPLYAGLDTVTEELFDKVIGVNLRGPLFWCQAAWEQALKQRPGVIINIASVGGLRAEGGLGVYNLTKAALIHLTRQLAGELGPTRVVGIAPGLVQTDFAAYLVENFGDRLAAQLPLQRLGDPQDIANLAVFLASDAASWITGETYVIDGGAGVRSTG